jgi:hypothetical protein
VLVSSGSIAASETTAGVVYSHREIGLYTNGVRTLGYVQEGSRALVTIGSRKMCIGIKILLKYTGMWKSRYAKFQIG